MEFDATFIVSTISFIVFVIIMNKILYQPILNIITKRRLYFEENSKETSLNLEKTQTLTDERQEKLNNASKNSREITSEGLLSAKNKKEEIIKDARENSNKDINSKLSEVKKEEENMVFELEKQTDELSDLIVERLSKEASNV